MPRYRIDELSEKDLMEGLRLLGFITFGAPYYLKMLKKPNTPPQHNEAQLAKAAQEKADRERREAEIAQRAEKWKNNIVIRGTSLLATCFLYLQSAIISYQLISSVLAFTFLYLSQNPISIESRFLRFLPAFNLSIRLSLEDIMSISLQLSLALTGLHEMAWPSLTRKNERCIEEMTKIAAEIEKKVEGTKENVGLLLAKVGFCKKEENRLVIYKGQTQHKAC